MAVVRGTSAVILIVKKFNAHPGTKNCYQYYGKMLRPERCVPIRHSHFGLTNTVFRYHNLCNNKGNFSAGLFRYKMIMGEQKNRLLIQENLGKNVLV